MTIEELLKACSGGEMPKVQSDSIIKGASSNIGTVVVIKQNTFVNDWCGCGVVFTGMQWDTWFNSESGTDKRRHYMSELKLIPSAS